MRETGGAVAVGGRDRHSMIYFGQSRGQTLGVQLDVGSRVPIATTAMGCAYIWALPEDERAALLRELREHYGSRWPRMRDGIERAGETVEKLGFAISAGEWHDDIQQAINFFSNLQFEFFLNFLLKGFNLKKKLLNNYY